MLQIDGLAEAVARANLGADVLAKAAAWVANAGARSVTQLENDDIDGAVCPRRIRHCGRDVWPDRPACSLVCFLPEAVPCLAAGWCAELVASLGLLKIPSRDLKRALEEASSVRALNHIHVRSTISAH